MRSDSDTGVLATGRTIKSPYRSFRNMVYTTQEGVTISSPLGTKAMQEVGISWVGTDPVGSCYTMSCGYFCYVLNQH